MKTQAYTIVHRDGHIWFSVAFNYTQTGNIKADCRLFSICGNQILRHHTNTNRNDKDKIAAVLTSFARTGRSTHTVLGDALWLQFLDVAEQNDWKITLLAGGHKVLQTQGDVL